MTGFCPELSDDVKEVRDWVHAFARDVIRPAGAEWDEREETPWPVIQEAAKIGLYSLDFFATQWFEESGLALPVAFEEIFWGDAGIGLSITGTGLAAAALAANGTPEQMGEWLPQMFGTENDVKLGAFCASEPDAGSDVGAIRTRAVRDGGDWVLNGVKTWATNGGIANVHIVVASVDPSLGTRGQASFIIPPGTPGLSMGQKFRKHGIRASHTAEVVLEDVRVPASCLLGGEEKLKARLARVRNGERAGEQAAMRTFETTRPSVAAMAVGIARAAFEYARDYARERTQFGRKIGEKVRIAACSPRWPPASTWPACSPGAPPGWPATAAASNRRKARCRSWWRARPPCGSPNRPSRSSAAPATPGTTRWNASTATPRSTPSSKAPRRSSA
jgi:alkylation response protein AidB-like acyl-CoA dehydrogenase